MPRNPAQLRAIGNTKDTWSLATLGTMMFGSLASEEESHKILDRYAQASDVSVYSPARATHPCTHPLKTIPYSYLELGGNSIDTAELYPVPPSPKTDRTELIIGRWLSGKPAGFREKLLITTKVAGPTSNDWVPQLRHKHLDIAGKAAPAAHTPEQIELALGASLKRLQTDYVDVLLLHWPQRWGKGDAPTFGRGEVKEQHMNKEDPTDYEGVAGCMKRLVETGKIRHWGLSNESSWGVMRWCAAADKVQGPAPVCIQQDHSLLDRRFEYELAETCAKRNCNLSLMAYGALCGGTLTGKYHHDEHGSSASAGHSKKRARQDLAACRHRKHPMFQARYHAPRSFDATARYLDAAKESGLSGTQLALGWSASRWYMGTVVLGATSVEQLEENWKACETELSDSVLEKIQDIHHHHTNPNVS